MAHNIRIEKTETLSDYFFPLQKVTYAFENKQGEREELSREVYCSKNGAVGLLYNKEKRTVILIKQFRLPAFLNEHSTGMLLEACAGILNEGEEAEATIVREIEEETGYKVKEAVKVFELYSTPGSVKEMLYFFIADYSTAQKVSEGGGLEDESEDIEVMEMQFEEAYEKISSGEIRDAKTVLLLQYAKLNIF